MKSPHEKALSNSKRLAELKKKAAVSDRAKKQFSALHKSGKMGIPSTAPSRWGTSLSTGEKR